MSRIQICYILSFLVLSSCSLFRYSDPKLRKVWMLSELPGFSMDSIITKKATIDMTEKEYGKVFMGCNDISYNYYNKHKSEIYFKGGLSSTSLCADMKLEERFNILMQTVSTYRIDGNRLFLYTTNEEIIIFVSRD